MILTTKEIEAIELAANCLATWMEIADPEDVREYDEEALNGLFAIVKKAKGEA